MTNTQNAGRPTQVSSARIKLMAIILSVVTFIASLAGVAIANPGRTTQTNQAVQAIQQPAGQSQLGLGQTNTNRLPMTGFRPMTRSRGS